MMGLMWCLWRCLVLNLLISLAVVRIRCETESLGFISIDCGIPANTSYVDNTTKISSVSDLGFTDTGVNRNVSVAYLSVPDLARTYLTLRSFPDGDRNCYTLGSLASGIKYLVRATFMYGEYDGLSKPPIFDVYLGVNLWGTVDLVASKFALLEIITFSTNDYLQVCLVNKKLGTPIISSLALRPLKPILYPDVNGNQSLVLVKRHNMGPNYTTYPIIRYPDDPHDRVWLPYDGFPNCTELSTTSAVKNLVDDEFEPPPAVMQTAMTPVNSNRIDYAWKPSSQHGGVDSFLIVLYVAELNPMPANAVREFTVILNDQLFLREPYSPQVRISNTIYGTARGFPDEYNVITLNATQRSTLQPILNAVEVFTVVPATQMPTDNTDASAVRAIKAWYQVKRNWVGDPCAPKAFVWDGLNCSYSAGSPARVTSLKLSNCSLTGAVIASFGDLKALQYLDLSQNNLSGPIPDFLEKISSLVYLDISGNKLDGPIPAGLLQRSQEGSLALRIGDICSNSSCESRKKSNKIAIIASTTVVVSLIVVSIIAVVFLCKGLRVASIQTERNETVHKARSLQFDNQNFSRTDLKKITNNFHEKIGEGVSGSVYAGQLDDGTLVAVKMINSSSHGIEGFTAEVQVLMKVHHKNLVSMIGCCKDTESLALVFELMSGGTLLGRLRGRESISKPLTWLQRLRIALNSAQGLEYLHTLCDPPLIHRDVKPANILLSKNLEAKLADFGISQAFDTDKTHLSLKVAGTHGYLDPEYYATSRLSEKSDVYSFGVVLLELVTGKLPILQAPENCKIAEWVQQIIARWNIDSVADPKMKGQYDVNSLWKVTDLALKCTSQSPKQRPTMTDVVVQLKDCLELAVASPITVHQCNKEISGKLPMMDNLHEEADYGNHDSILEIQPLSLRAV